MNTDCKGQELNIGDYVDPDGDHNNPIYRKKQCGIISHFYPIFINGENEEDDAMITLLTPTYQTAIIRRVPSETRKLTEQEVMLWILENKQ